MDHNHQHALKLNADLILKRAVAGGFAGCCSTIVGHPFDTVKVRIQINNEQLKNHQKHNDNLRHTQRIHQHRSNEKRFRHVRNTFHCAGKILRNEGKSGFYKGMLFPLLSSVPWTAATFVGYTLGERLYESMSGLPPGEFSNKKTIVGGFAAGLSSSFVACPIDRVKCLLQAQTSKQTKGRLNKSVRYRSPFHCAYKLYMHSGFFHGNYKGFGITLIRRVPCFGVHFFVYENIKQLMMKRKQERSVSEVEMLVAGGVAGTASCLVWIAPDTIKTRVQTAHPGQYPHGMRSVIREMIHRREPVTILFRGLPPALMRACPSTAVYMLAYEAFLKHWYKETHLSR